MKVLYIVTQSDEQNKSGGVLQWQVKMKAEITKIL